ncbi:MAG: M36 family metallopeptidase [Saprospiraceae bacterium]
MKKFLLMQTVLLLSTSFISTLFSQSTDYISKAYEFLGNTYGFDQSSIGELSIQDKVYSEHIQVTHVHFVQTYNGLQIFNTHFNLAFQSNGKVSASGHTLKTFKSFPSITNTPSIQASEAIGIVANELGISSRSIPTFVKETKSGKPVYSKAEIALQDIPIELGYYLSSTAEFHLAYRMNIESAKNGQLYESFVDAIDGKLLAHILLTLHCSFEHGFLAPQENCDHQEATFVQAPPSPPLSALGSYRVLPLTVESPNHGSFELVSGVNDPLASPFGWHDVDGEEGSEYTYTRGNNVHAYLDRNWDYNSDMDVSGGAGLVFDFPYDPNLEPSGNQNAAATNLFYWNNIMHDFAYHYGFNEIAGNFQDLNYTGQGMDEDYVEAHAQHGDSDVNACGNQDNGGVACLNNANFSTPIDGFNGRMKMFTWDQNSSNKFLDVLEPVEYAGKILTGLASFGPDITTTPVTGLVEIADAANSNSTQGCSVLTDEVDYNGKIVIIDRGICDFSEKVLHAQDAGAIGAIICNFEEGVIAMGPGQDAELVTIPSVLIANSDCQRIRVAAAKGLKVSLVSPPPDGGPVRRDGAVDNSVIAHEYAHGISNRLTGGPSASNCLSEEEGSSLGEGWSDFFALVTTVKPGDTGAKRRGIGTFASKESTDGRGIRTFPYSTEMSENPHTFDDVLFEGVPHGVGSVWAAMLWDLYWAFSDAYGWDADLYNGTGGNNIVIQLVMDGLKLQPCNPGFIDARNAIIQADQINNNGVNECLIWQVFARRGLGWDADGGDPSETSDAIAGFQSLPTCIKELKLTKTLTEEIVAGDPIEVRLHAINHTDGTLTNVTIEDNISEGTSYIAGSANMEPVTGNTLVWILDEMTPGEVVEIVYQLQSDPGNHSIKLEFDDIEGDAYGRWDIDYDPEKTIDNAWFQEDIFTRNGSGSWKVGDVETESEHYLQNLDAYTIGGTYPVYRFYHYFDTEAGSDGGFLEITTNNGADWIPLADKVFRNGYERRLQYATFAIPDLYAFSGLSSVDLEWIPVYIDLRDYIGQDVKIRYRFGTDSNTPGDGWYIDDVELMDAVVYNSTACIVSDQTSAICAEAPERGTIVDSQIASGTGDVLDNSSLLVHPNPAGDYVQIALTADVTEDARLNVFDLTGKSMYSIKWNLTEGMNQHLLELSGYTPGMYVVQIQTAEGIYSKKFIRK